MFALTLFGLTADAGVNPPDAEIENAIVVDIPPDGFARVVEIIPALIPMDLPVDDVSEDISRGGSCWDDIWFDISDLNIGISVADADIIPKEGFLDFGVALEVNINDAVNPFLLDYMLSLCIEYNCEAYVDPFQVDIAAQIMMSVADLDGDGVNELNASFENFSYNYDLTSDDINVENCALSTFESVLNFFGLSVFDLILSIVEPTIEELVVELVPTLEETIEDAFNQLSIQESIEFEGSTLDVALNPDDITIKPEGLRVQMNGSATTGAGADCISAFDPNGSLATPTTLRNIGYKPPGVSGDVLVTIDDDFANQILYSAWRSGVLCQTIDASTFPIDTSILNLITGDAFVDLFPETSPLIIQTKPAVPLELNMTTASDAAIDVEDLGLDFFAEIDGRQTRILTLGINTDVGINIPFNTQTGDLAVDIDLNGDRVDPSLSYNEFLPDSDELIMDSFIDQFDTILGLIDIESLIGDLAFTLPAINGVGLSDLEFAGTGQNTADLGAFASIGVVPYTTGTGCGEDGDAGCEEGCSSNGRTTPKLAILMGLLMFGLVRRRST